MGTPVGRRVVLCDLPQGGAPIPHLGLPRAQPPPPVQVLYRCLCANESQRWDRALGSRQLSMVLKRHCPPCTCFWEDAPTVLYGMELGRGCPYIPAPQYQFPSDRLGQVASAKVHPGLGIDFRPTSVCSQFSFTFLIHLHGNRVRSTLAQERQHRAQAQPCLQLV